MQAGSVLVRGVLVSLLAVALCACAAMEFGSNACRTVYVLSGGGVQPVNSCGGIPREGLMAQMAVSGNDLATLLAAPKFEADAYYRGVGRPGDKALLTKAVNDAVRNVIAMPAPRNASAVRQTLAQAVQVVDVFATDDREHAHMYLVLAWRAAGFTSESMLFPVADEDVITVP